MPVSVCPNCNTVYFNNASSLDYEDDYFTTQYRNQYGRTYEEDKSNINRLNTARIEYLLGNSDIGNRPNLSVLEIGCAFGYFLEALAKKLSADGRSSFQFHGLELSEYAVTNAVRHPQIKIEQGSFLESRPAELSSEPKYDLVAAFFVLEHFPNQKDFWEQVTKLIRPGGYFYAAVPSMYGPLFYWDPRRWLDTHPQDHFADYSPTSFRNILPFYGLECIGFRTPSFHPNRAKGLTGSISKLMNLLPPTLGRSTHPSRDWYYRRFAASRYFGDTLEVLAVKSP